MTNMFKCTPRTARTFMVDCMLAGVVPYLKSSPGIGKSSLVRSIAKEYGMILIDHRLSTSAPEDLTGLPTFIEQVDSSGKIYKQASFAPFDTFPTEGVELPTGFNGWILFLDEFNSAPKSVQAAAYKLILDHAVGNHKLHPKVKIICAGNLSTDRAIVNPLSTAMQSRLIHLEMQVSHQEWLEDVAIAEQYDPRIIAYLSYKPSSLMDFRPDHNDQTFCCPRTWEFMNRLLKGKEFKTTRDSSGNEIYEMDLKSPLYAGTITSGVAIEFINFTKVFNKLPKIEDIVNDPKGIPIPGDSPTKYAVTMYLASKTTNENFEDLNTYVKRMSADFRVLFIRFNLKRNPEIKKHPAFQSVILELNKYIYD